MDRDKRYRDAHREERRLYMMEYRRRKKKRITLWGRIIERVNRWREW